LAVIVKKYAPRFSNNSFRQAQTLASQACEKLLTNNQLP
jgi:hypothetical protein